MFIAGKALSFFLISLFFSCFLSNFFSPHVLSRGSDGRGQNTSSREMSEGSGENGHQGLKKKRSPVGFFSWLESTMENASADFLARFGSNSVFLVIQWLVCYTDSPWVIRQWMLSISSCSLPLQFTLFMFTLLPQHVAKSSWKKIGQLVKFLCFSHVSCPFFSPHVLSRRSDGRGQNTSSREMSEGSGGNGHQVLKSRSFVGFFFFFSAWLKVWVDGPESTKEYASGDYFTLRLEAIVCFLWFSDLCVTQTARATSASECWASYLYVLSLSPVFSMFTLLPQHVAKSYWKDRATWGGANPFHFFYKALSRWTFWVKNFEQMDARKENMKRQRMSYLSMSFLLTHFSNKKNKLVR